MLYYNYNADYPNGNGWVKSKYSYDGEIIDSPDYIFPRGKYKGKTLQNIVESCWRGIIKYIDYGLIFITNKCLNKLYCSSYKLSAIRAANDSKLFFCRVYDISDELYTKPLACSYQEESFLDIAERDPKYLIQIIDRGMFPRYGQNQRFYAKDNSLTMLIDDNGDAVSKLQHYISQFEQKDVARLFVSYAKHVLVEYQSLKEEFEERRILRFEDDFDDIDNGYRVAFEDDPEAVWNID